MLAKNETEVGGEPLPVAPAGSEQRVPKGIAILGSNPQTRLKAPFDDDWLIFACSPDNSPYGRSSYKGVLPRVDAWCELHVPIAHTTRPYGYLRWLESLPCPVFMRDAEALPLFPNAQPYPEKELKKRFGPYIFTSSIAYIQALAIRECERMGIKRLGLWGIMQGVDEHGHRNRGGAEDEYFKHRTGTQHFLWEAHRLGIEVELPPEAAQLLAPPPEDW
jgi:hypothetical protein